MMTKYIRKINLQNAYDLYPKQNNPSPGTVVAEVVTNQNITP